MQKKWISAAVLAVVLAIFAGLFVIAHPARAEAVPLQRLFHSGVGQCGLDGRGNDLLSVAAHGHGGTS